MGEIVAFIENSVDNAHINSDGLLESRVNLSGKTSKGADHD